jgi:hypothetical protein
MTWDVRKANVELSPIDGEGHCPADREVGRHPPMT